MSFWYFEEPKLQKRFSFTWGLALVFIDYWTLEVTVERCLFANHLHNLQAKTRMFGIKKLQKTAFSLVKSRLAPGSPGCLGVCSSSPCRKWPNTQENGCWLPPSDHIQSETLFQTRQDQEKGMDGPASLLHSWLWVSLFHTLLGFSTKKVQQHFLAKFSNKNQMLF